VVGGGWWGSISLPMGHAPPGRSSASLPTDLWAWRLTRSGSPG
jgi:hypothetical protein